MESIIINYNGWIKVDKKDLKLQTINDNSGEMEDFDTSNLSADEIVSLINKGTLYLESFGETYQNNALDGEDNFDYETEINDWEG
jgi:hypothetical protein